MRSREIPKGLRDLLPDEAKNRRNIENKAAQLFHSFGYDEVVTPTFEFMDVIEKGGSTLRDKLFLFMDREGGILSLRPEMTVSIARLAATHLQDEPMPQRLFYSANVFRHVQPQMAQYREFWQLGIEMLGASGAWADAEVISLAVMTLKELGLEHFKVSLNQVGIFNSLLAESSTNPNEREQIRNLVERKDLVELSRLLERLPIHDDLKETIARLPVLHGDMEVLNQIPYVENNRAASQAVEELIKVYEALQIYGVSDHVVIDMGVLRGLDYYTGVVFEGYSPELGYGLLGGGRYDNLLSQFGYDCPATGFAIGMDRLALVLGQQEQEQRYLLGGKNLEKMVREASKLRDKGIIVEIDIEGNSQEVLEQKIKEKTGYSLLYLGNE
ncbi:MAG: ATP phosphoribosyltransferase regulatory subunit [Bacillota bacterium]|nr:ATP phosphoribosyltransferase regulatory subunit [Bacillota bacterium]